MNTEDIDQQIWRVIALIPSGKVATYGDVARQAGLPGAARRVGYSLKRLPQGTRLPWHRVINAQGRISLRRGSASHTIQREKLESEGIEFSARGTVDMSRFRWSPETA